MVNHTVDMRETVGMALCALLSLAVFLPLLAYGGRLPAALALTVSLACPVVWLLFLLWINRSGGGLVQESKHMAAGSRPALRWDGQPAGTPSTSKAFEDRGPCGVTFY